MELNLETLIATARTDETFLSQIFLGLKETQDFDSVADWLCHVLKKTKLAHHFELPSKPKLVNAYVEILKSPSLITAPVLRVITNRLHIYFSNIPEVLTHSMASQELANASHYLHSLLGLLKKYGPKTERTSPAIIAQALQSDSIHEYQDEWNDTALRVVLRTLYSAPRAHSSAAKDNLLDFVVKQLEHEIARAGHIPEPRHAWWAVVTLLSRAQPCWLNDRRKVFAKAISHLMELTEYSVREDVANKSVAPELKTREMENIWVGINASRLLRSEFASQLSVKLLRRLRDCLSARLHTTKNLTVGDSFKVRSVHLLFTYDLLRLQATEEARACCRWKRVNVDQYRVGASYWSNAVLSQVKLLGESATRFLKTSSDWTKHTLTSALLCGLPGQGKSELIQQLGAHLRGLCQRQNRQLKACVHAVGKQVSSEQDLKKILEKYQAESKQDTQAVFFMVFDEVDKAQGFNFYTPFLDALEERFEPARKALTFWLFAQSSYPSLAAAKEYAGGLPNKSMRDFLTRMQWGDLELPELRFSPDQRLMAAVGCTMLKQGTLNGFTGRWGAHFLGASHLRNVRDLITEVQLAAAVDPEGFVDVSKDRQAASPRWLNNLPGNGKNRITIVT